MEAKIFSSGICVRTRENHLWCIRDFDTRMPLRLADAGPPGCLTHCFDVIPPPMTSDGPVEVIAAVGNDLVKVDEDGSLRFAQGMGPFVAVTASPNGLFLACMTEGDSLLIFNILDETLMTRFCVFDASRGEAGSLDTPMMVAGQPQHLVWCGTEAIIAYWTETSTCLLLTIDGNHCWWDMEGVETITPEVDGAYFLAQDSVHFCRMVPESSMEILEPGSVSPGALLYDSRESLGKEDVTSAVQILEIIGSGKMEQAAQSCIDAAGFEMNPEVQQSLLRAGCFGMTFAPVSLPKGKSIVRRGGTIMELARSLRILNAVRVPQIGLPLTLVQLGALGMDGLLERLCNLEEYHLSLRICDSINFSPEGILRKWACKKIAAAPASLPDRALFSALLEKLHQYRDLSWIEIANFAAEQGRHNLAARLVEEDHRMSQQISMLLHLGLAETALDRGAMTGDPDAIFEILHHERHRREKIVQTNRMAASIYRKCLEMEDERKLLEFFSSLQEHDSCAILHVKRAVDNEEVDTIDHAWAIARDEFLRSDKIVKEEKFFGNAAAAAHRLVQHQRALEASSGREGFVGMSVLETIRKCVQYGLNSEALKLVKEFKVPERQHLLVTLDVMGASRDWAAMSHIAHKLDKKSSISTEDVLECANGHGAPIQALKDIVTGVQDDARRAHLFETLGLHEEAAMAQESAVIGSSASAGVFGNLKQAVGTTASSLGWKLS